MPETTTETNEPTRGTLRFLLYSHAIEPLSEADKAEARRLQGICDEFERQAEDHDHDAHKKEIERGIADYRRAPRAEFLENVVTDKAATKQKHQVLRSAIKAARREFITQVMPLTLRPILDKVIEELRDRRNNLIESETEYLESYGLAFEPSPVVRALNAPIQFLMERRDALGTVATIRPKQLLGDLMDF